MVTCPRCGVQVTELHPIPADMQSQLQALGETSFTELCLSCQSEIRKNASQMSGGVLMAQERAKEQHRLQLWKSRVNLIKKARNMMAMKQYPEAAISYEKYIRILEIVFNCKKGEHLTPEHFKDTARTSELTVVSSVYWDLMRIYDTHDRYHERQKIAAQQLALFARFTPIFPDILKRAEVFAKNSKNPAVIRSFLKNAVEDRPRCFITTAAFENANSTEVLQLRIFRDFVLEESFWGRLFVKIYYVVSPPIACLIDQQKWMKPFVRAVLRWMIKRVS